MSATVYLVGIGPGQAELVTPEALKAIGKVSVVIGQPECLLLVEALTRGKEVIAERQSPLGRSRLAVEKAQAGQDVAIISSGDPGVYAIAATFLEYLKDNNITLDVKVVPGVGLAGYAAARLGAPLGNDSAAITLTDQGTPWPVIRKRLEAAASADFVIVIYNPFGKLGPSRLQEALKIIAEYRTAQTLVGVLSKAATPDEQVQITTLGEVNVLALPVDTLLIIGNSQSYARDGRMVTPRLYREGVGY
ncbi:MAG: precorrin-3B C(17)-methyltransferase [Dehalococcoidia bacterium]|nr:MAG: precorrin-3B C(17)-methyltransferase [Dehalococcoidia bacterium]